MREGPVRVPVRAATPSPGGRGLTGVTGIVLAGGRSTRFGADKLAADLPDVPLLHHAVHRLAEVCGEVVVVLSPDGEEPSFPPGTPVRTARDAREGQGPLAGLVAGLEVVVSQLLCGPFISREFCDACMHDPARFQFHHHKDIPCSK